MEEKKEMKENLEEKEEETKKVELESTEEKTTKEEEKKLIKGKRNYKKVIICSIIIITILAFFSTIFAIINVNNKCCIKGVTINGIDVSSYTREELSKMLKEFVEKNQKKIIELKYEDQVSEITPEVLGTSYNIQEIVEEAYSFGRKDNIIINNYKILQALIFKKNFEFIGTPDEQTISDSILTINNKLEGKVEEPSYYIEGEKLFITKGKEGIRISEQQLKENIISEINNFNSEVCLIEIPIEDAKPEEIDIEKIHEEIYCEPQDAYISQEPVTVHPNINGVDFAITIEEAKEIIKADQEEFEIPLKITIAEITLVDLGKEAFPNQLGTFTTTFYVGETSRSTNIRLATQKIDGIIVLPGETFSYNATVGKRTVEAGFKSAGAYSAGKIVQEVGGGICQVSTTLYNAVLYANLEIVERHNHYFESSYVDASRDATVSWGGPDFKFKNNRKYPIKIIASSNNGKETVSIYGLYEEDEYEVEIQSKRLSTISRKIEYIDDDSLLEGEESISQNGHDGCTSEAYKILKRNGEIVSQKLLSRDTYSALTRIIKRGTKKQQTTPEEPTEEVIVTAPEVPSEEKAETGENPSIEQ